MTGTLIFSILLVHSMIITLILCLLLHVRTQLTTIEDGILKQQLAIMKLHNDVGNRLNITTKHPIKRWKQKIPKKKTDKKISI